MRTKRSHSYLFEVAEGKTKKNFEQEASIITSLAEKYINRNMAERAITPTIYTYENNA